MLLLTMIARVADGLPLAASIQEDEQVSSWVPATPSPPHRISSLDPGDFPDAPVPSEVLALLPSGFGETTC